MMLLSKALLLATYALALLGLFMPLPLDAGPWLLKLSLVLLGIHALETALMFRHVRRYPGALSASVVLSLLFGLLHWWPLSRQTSTESDR